MTVLPIVCPKCGSWELEPVPPAGLPGLRQRIRQFSGGRLYQCEGCHWRGYIAKARVISPWLWLWLFLAALAVLIPLLLAL